MMSYPVTFHRPRLTKLFKFSYFLSEVFCIFEIPVGLLLPDIGKEWPAGKTRGSIGTNMPVFAFSHTALISALKKKVHWKKVYCRFHRVVNILVARFSKVSRRPIEKRFQSGGKYSEKDGRSRWRSQDGAGMTSSSPLSGPFPIWMEMSCVGYCRQ